MIDILSPYAKAVVAAICGILVSTLVVVQSVVGDGFSVEDGIVVAVALLQAVVVYLVPNKPPE